MPVSATVWLNDVFLDNNEALWHKRQRYIRLCINTQYDNHFIVGFRGICSHNKTSIIQINKYIPIQKGEAKGARARRIKQKHHSGEQSVFSHFLTSSVKMPMTGLWSLMLYSMTLVYRSCLTFRGYSSSSSIWLTFSASRSTLSSSCISGGEALGRSRHRILSVQAGLRFLLLTGGYRGWTDTDQRCGL